MRDKNLAKRNDENVHAIGPKELGEVCRGGPEVLFIGCTKVKEVVLSEQAQRYLSQRSIRCEILPAVQLIDLYNKSKARKAALIHVTC